MVAGCWGHPGHGMGCLLCVAGFLGVVAAAPDVPAFLPCVGCCPALEEDWAAVAPGRGYLSVVLVVASPAGVVYGVGAARAFTACGEGE